MDDLEKIELILEWADNRPNFDTSFVESLQDFYEQAGFLTASQSAALDSIIEGFRIQ